MASIVQKLHKGNFITPPKWLSTNLVYEVMMGSHAYGTEGIDSDYDIYGVVIPPKKFIFPHLGGYIPGFGTNPPSFNNYQQHHIIAFKNEYDVDVASIVTYFTGLMNCSPNVIDSLFVPEHAILHTTNIGNIIRDSRKMFLSKKAWITFRGYARSQSKKMTNKTSNSKRYWMIEKSGYDWKSASHVVRLLLEVEQIILNGDLDLLIGRETVRAVKEGAYSLEEISEWIIAKERALEEAYTRNCILPNKPDEAFLKQLLMDCLEEHYGSLAEVVTMPNQDREALREISKILGRLDLWQ